MAESKARLVVKSAWLILTTVSKRTDAAKLSRALVKKKLAACVQTYSGVESQFLWDGALCSEKEFLLIIKTLDVAAVEAYLDAHHPYKTPEILSLKINRVSKKYLLWMRGFL